MKRSAFGRHALLAVWVVFGVVGFSAPATADDPAPRCRDGVLIGDRYCATGSVVLPVAADPAPRCRDGVLIGDRYCAPVFAAPPVTEDEALHYCRDGVLISDRYCATGSASPD